MMNVKVLRGFSWGGYKYGCSCSNRNDCWITSITDIVGFRIVLKAKE
jgi:formylglycine-generating enzyme required for sulfatase activity